MQDAIATDLDNLSFPRQNVAAEHSRIFRRTLQRKCHERFVKHNARRANQFDNSVGASFFYHVDGSIFFKFKTANVELDSDQASLSQNADLRTFQKRRPNARQNFTGKIFQRISG